MDVVALAVKIETIVMFILAPRFDGESGRLEVKAESIPEQQKIKLSVKVNGHLEYGDRRIIDSVVNLFEAFGITPVTGSIRYVGGETGPLRNRSTFEIGNPMPLEEIDRSIPNLPTA